MQNNYPLVSVIIPFLNAENFLEDTVNSVLTQEYSNWEIILIDDGSTDQSTNIAKDFSIKYPGKIIYAEHPGHANKAAAASRNLGLSICNGEYVAFLDADDIWLPGKLLEQISIFQKYPQISMVCEASLYWYSWQNTDAEDLTTPVGVPNDMIYFPPELAVRLYPLRKGNAPCPSGAIAKRVMLKNIKGFVESFTGKNAAFEDIAFFTKVYLNEVVYVSSSCNNLYRQRFNSVMNEMKVSGNYQAAKHFYFEWLKNYLKEHHIANKTVKYLLWKSALSNKHHFLSRIINKVESLTATLSKK